jgi:hypothetical protein
MLPPHCLAAWPLPPAHALGDGAKPPENRQNLPVDALGPAWQDVAAMNESEKQFSFTRVASSTSERARKQFLIRDGHFLRLPRALRPKLNPQVSSFNNRFYGL